MIEMFFLIYCAGCNSSVVMPEKYTKEQCEKVGRENMNNNFKCIPAPYQCFVNTAVPDDKTPYTGGMKIIQVPSTVCLGVAK